jgi:hypothetical protein
MAKLNGIFKYDGTFQGVTSVDSRAYGKHIRKARTKFTLGQKMKESSAAMKQANVYAKVFQDAIDPYRRDFRDGMLWQRLVSIFKRQLLKEGKVDFSPLEDHDLNKTHSLSWIISAKVSAVQADRTLHVDIISSHARDTTNGRADGYQQTLIGHFVDNALQVKTFSESAFISFNANPGEQQVSFTIPEGSTTAILVLKCNFSSGSKPLELQKGMGMRVMKVVEIKGELSEKNI